MNDRDKPPSFLPFRVELRGGRSTAFYPSWILGSALVALGVTLDVQRSPAVRGAVQGHPIPCAGAAGGMVKDDLGHGTSCDEQRTVADFIHY